MGRDLWTCVPAHGLKAGGKVCLLIKILPQIRASAELAYWEDRLYIISASPATTASPTFHLYSLQERQLLLKIAPLKRCRLFYAVMSFYFLTKPSQYFVSLFFFFSPPSLRYSQLETRSTGLIWIWAAPHGSKDVFDGRQNKETLTKRTEGEGGAGGPWDEEAEE